MEDSVAAVTSFRQVICFHRVVATLLAMQVEQPTTNQSQEEISTKHKKHACKAKTDRGMKMQLVKRIPCHCLDETKLRQKRPQVQLFTKESSDSNPTSNNLLALQGCLLLLQDLSAAALGSPTKQRARRFCERVLAAYDRYGVGKVNIMNNRHCCKHKTQNSS